MKRLIKQADLKGNGINDGRMSYMETDQSTDQERLQNAEQITNKKEPFTQEDIDKLNNEMAAAQESNIKMITFLGDKFIESLKDNNDISDNDEHNITDVFTHVLDDADQNPLIQKIKGIVNKLRNIKLADNFKLKINRKSADLIYNFCDNNQAKIEANDKICKFAYELKKNNMTISTYLSRNYKNSSDKQIGVTFNWEF